MRLKNNGDSCTISRVAFFHGTELAVPDETIPHVQYAIDSKWFSVVEPEPAPPVVSPVVSPAAKTKPKKPAK